MISIDIDFDVYKALTIKRSSEDVTYNDVLRDLLGLTGKEAEIGQPSGALENWVAKGVAFPEGTEFRANYRGRAYAGKVVSGALIVDGKKYDSPSAAAVAIKGHAANGWLFWECRFPGKNSWQAIKSLRK